MKNNVVFRPTVVIGLGGTGYGALLKLKKRFIDAYGFVPPIISFLSIDTTENAEGGAATETAAVDGKLDHNETFVLQVGHPAALVNGGNPHIDEWWPPQIPTQSIIAGAGQVRARGRLALFARANDVYGRIRRAVDDVRNIRNQKQMYADQFQVSTRAGVEVHIVGSVAGGTGSGTFLDIAFMARDIIGSDEQSNFTGVLLLPGIFTRYAGVALVKPNAYGALKEIEYLSTMKGSFTIDYGVRRVEVARPPFDLVYLIDNINEQGRVVSEQQDLYGLIADGMYVQIGSQIGADSANAVDNIKTQIATAGRVKGRSPQYCSFGVASLVMPSFEPLMWEDAKRLVNDDLLNGAVVDAEVEVEVQRFIDGNRLREDNADQVIESLSQREGGGQLRFPMSLAQLKFDNKALTEIKNLHTSHRSRAERQIAQAIAKNFEALRDNSVAAINAWWETAVNRNNGFTRAERFFEKLQAKLEWYQNMMDGEAKEERAKLKALSYKPAEDQIGEAVGAFLKRESRIKTACEVYGGLADRETELTIKVARMEKAAELYSVLHAHTQSILQSCYRIRENLNAARKQFEQQYLDATNPRGASRLFEQTVSFDPGAQRPQVTGEDFVKWYADHHNGSLAQWATLRADEVYADVRQFVQACYAPLTSLTMDDILGRLSAEAVAQELKRVDNLAVPLWRYDAGKIPVVNQSVINEFYHYGVADADTTILKESKYETGVPKGATRPSMVSTHDAHRVLLFKVKTGIPLFALADIDDMERAYLDPNKVISNHVDKRWQDIPNLIPRSGDGEALRWFALAQAPEPFAIIKRDGAWYSMKSKSGRRVDNGLIRLGQGRVPAYAAFEKNRELVAEAEEAIDTIVTREGAARAAAILKEYTLSLSKQMAGVADAAVKDQVELEVVAIEDYVRRMETLS
ncbi:MAG TPA: tubulin-like doman-containing protein [Thermoanaerobaculia bacterium]|nr:tubulin-like doman-containing protein [Thermoanaerobaculia bacterium]